MAECSGKHEMMPVRCGCGGGPHIVNYWSADYAQTVWYVRCKECDIASGDYFSEAEAVAGWNKAMGAFNNNAGHKGKWIESPFMFENEKCSECGHYFPVGEFMHRPFDINFCPNCGADMRGEHEHV